MDIEWYIFVGFGLGFAVIIFGGVAMYYAYDSPPKQFLKIVDVNGTEHRFNIPAPRDEEVVMMSYGNSEHSSTTNSSSFFSNSGKSSKHPYELLNNVA